MNSSLLYTNQKVRHHISFISRSIRKTYCGEEVYLVGILNGCIPLLSELMTDLSDMKLYVETIKVNSYKNNKRTDNIKIDFNFNINKLKDKKVILVDDIYDSGKTITAIKNMLIKVTSEIKYCVLLKRNDKKEPLLIDEYIQLDTDKFLFGFGLDYNGLYRNLPDIYVVNEDK